jgi:long-chain fatty acid transport protein
MVRAVLRPALTIAFILAATLGTAGTARATPQDIFGFGARSPGLGFTGVSYADDYEAAFLNPAGLARARTNGLWVGLSAGTFQLKLDDERYPAESSRGMTIGFTLPLPFGDVLEDRLVLGGGFFTPSEVLLSGTIEVLETPQFNVLERVQAAAIMVGFGFDFHDWIDGLRIGASVSVAADVIGDLVVFLDETNAFSSVVETQLVTTYAPIVGASYDHDRWGLGLTYRFELSGVMDLAVVAEDLPIEIPEFYVGGTVHYDPATLAAEGYFLPVDDLRLALQLQTRFWNSYPGPQRQVTETSGVPPDPGYNITLSPRISGEWDFVDERGLFGQLRLGYAFEPTPANPARMVDKLDAAGNPTGELVPLRYLDNHRHVATLGLGFRYEFVDDMFLELDVFGQLHVLMKRTHDIGRTDGAPPMQTRGTMLAGGWTLGLTY